MRPTGNTDIHFDLVCAAEEFYIDEDGIKVITKMRPLYATLIPVPVVEEDKTLPCEGSSPGSSPGGDTDI